MRTALVKSACLGSQKLVIRACIWIPKVNNLQGPRDQEFSGPQFVAQYYVGPILHWGVCAGIRTGCAVDKQ